MNDLAGMVTVAASGIGRATTQLPAERGARVAVLDRDLDAVPEGLHSVRCDVADDARRCVAPLTSRRARWVGWWMCWK